MSSSCGFGIATIDAEGHQAGHPNDTEIVNDYSSWTGGPVLVPWGSDWTLVTWNFYVPTTYYTYVTCGGGALPTPNDVHPCDPVQINSMVVWFGQLDRTANAYNWFADAQLYINPYCSPSPMIDNLVVLFSLLLNIDMILVFGFRGQRHTRSEAKLGTVSTLLLIPFTILWLLNLLSNSDLGRLITPFPVIILLAYDLWSRTATKRKPQHHPENWPLGRYIYLLLYIIGGIMLNGYAFLVSLPYGFVVLASFCGSLMAYGYYKYSQEKFKKSQNQQAIHNE